MRKKQTSCLMQNSFLGILLAMLKPVQERGIYEKMRFFSLLAGRLFQVGLFPHKKSQTCPFQHETGL